MNPQRDDVSPSPATDHPQYLGDLGPVLARRRIAAGIDTGGGVVLARPDSVLVRVTRDGERETVAQLVADFDDKQAREIAQRAPDGPFVTVRIPAQDGVGAERKPNSLGAVNDLIGRFRTAGLTAELNTVFLGAQSFIGSPVGSAAEWVGEMAFPSTVATGPNGEPALLSTAQPTTPPRVLRLPLNLKDRQRPRVLVLDTGLRTESGAGTKPEHGELNQSVVHQPWLDRSTAGSADDEDEPDDDGLGLLDFEAGHGTFICGIIRQLCPDAEIHVAGVLSSFGDGDVATVTEAMRRVIDLVGPPDVVVMSFGGNFPDDDPGLFGEALMELLGDAVGIAAAGNQGTCRPYFPAALPGVIGVGGLAADGKAWFTNFGGWVDACAPAIDVVSTFFADFTEEIEGHPTRQYTGWARWSGTSFSAPKVAALIAQEQYLYGGTAAEAWKRMTSHKMLRSPDLGIVFNA
ncbi:hypothetical protein BH24ACT5_BH24ACT5_05360 [soil metagenome]